MQQSTFVTSKRHQYFERLPHSLTEYHALQESSLIENGLEQFDEVPIDPIGWGRSLVYEVGFSLWC